MGYLYFLIVLAASGAIIFWFGQRSVAARKREKPILSSQQVSNLPDVSARALKRSFGNIHETDSEHSDFLERVDVWQKEHQVRRTRFTTNTESVTGTKYTYSPPPKSRSAETRSN